MNILICETEPVLRKQAAHLTESLGHEVVGQADSLDEARSLLMIHQPEVLIISAHIPHVDEFCGRLYQDFSCPPALIFSGMDNVEMTLLALRAGASDYLLIPFQVRDLEFAFKKCCRMNAAQRFALDQKSGKSNRPRQYIAARTHRGVELIALSDVYYFTADQKYVKVRHKNGMVLIDETLKDLEQEFEGMMFRIHRNALINLDYLDLLETVDSGQYQVRFRGMSEALVVSRRHLPMLREKIQSI